MYDCHAILPYIFVSIYNKLLLLECSLAPTRNLVKASPKTKDVLSKIYNAWYELGPGLVGWWSGRALIGGGGGWTLSHNST